ncbi:MAG: CBS domain-containing protein [Ruminiclostridium sp.]
MNILFLLKPKAEIAYIFDHSTLRQGLEKMKFHGYTALPVISDSGLYVGTVSEGDFLWHIIESGKGAMQKQEEYTVSEIIRKGWNPAVKVTATMDELLLRVMDQNFVPVTDDRGTFIGIITRRDIIKYFYDKDTAKG